MLLGGLVLLARPGLLAVGFDLTLVIAVVLILGGAVLLLTGIWNGATAPTPTGRTTERSSDRVLDSALGPVWIGATTLLQVARQPDG